MNRYIQVGVEAGYWLSFESSIPGSVISLSSTASKPILGPT
jgi:hypothetical protein